MRPSYNSGSPGRPKMPIPRPGSSSMSGMRSYSGASIIKFGRMKSASSGPIGAEISGLSSISIGFSLGSGPIW